MLAVWSPIPNDCDWLSIGLDSHQPAIRSAELLSQSATSRRLSIHHFLSQQLQWRNWSTPSKCLQIRPHDQVLPAVRKFEIHRNGACKLGPSLPAYCKCIGPWIGLVSAHLVPYIWLCIVIHEAPKFKVRFYSLRNIEIYQGSNKRIYLSSW